MLNLHILLIHRSFAGKKENLHDVGWVGGEGAWQADDELPEGRLCVSALSAPLPSPFLSECRGTDVERDPGIPLQM